MPHYCLYFNFLWFPPSPGLGIQAQPTPFNYSRVSLQENSLEYEFFVGEQCMSCFVVQEVGGIMSSCLEEVSSHGGTPFTQKQALQHLF